MLTLIKARRPVRFIPMLILPFCLGCSGGRVDGQARLNAFNDLLADVSAQDATATAQLPESGTALYVGLLSAALPLADAAAPVTHTAQIEISVDFGATGEAVTGTAQNFVAVDGTTLGGTLVITNGTIDREAEIGTDYVIAADLDGTLTQGGGSYDVAAEIAGDFYGRDADAVAGVVYGDITGPDGIDSFDGAFVATEQ